MQNIDLRASQGADGAPIVQQISLGDLNDPLNDLPDRENDIEDLGLGDLVRQVQQRNRE